MKFSTRMKTFRNFLLCFKHSSNHTYEYRVFTFEKCKCIKKVGGSCHMEKSGSIFHFHRNDLPSKSKIKSDCRLITHCTHLHGAECLKDWDRITHPGPGSLVPWRADISLKRKTKEKRERKTKPRHTESSCHLCPGTGGTLLGLSVHIDSQKISTTRTITNRDIMI